MAVRASEDVGDLAHARPVLGLRLAHRAPELLGGEVGGDVQACARGGRDRDAVVAGDVVLRVKLAAVDAQARLGSALVAEHDHVHWATDPRPVLPQRRRREAAEDRSLAAGEDGGHEVPVQRPRLMADGVDAVVDAVKLPTTDADPDGLIGQAALQQLL